MKMGRDDSLAINIARKILELGSSFLFEYHTPRLVTMRSRRIGLIYRLVQLLLFVYLLGYVFISNKSYQTFDMADSSIMTKVKGTLLRHVNSSSTELWDNNDFVVPAQEKDAFFIATNLLYTYNQHQGSCPEDPNVGKEVLCNHDIDCTPAGTPTPYGNGIRTGNCSHSTGTCEISGWCPTETDIAPEKPSLMGFDSVSVLVKNHIIFRKFGVKRRNILDSFSQNYLQDCRYHPVNDPLCPVFALRDIIKFANEDFDVMAIKGGSIGFLIQWDCDLDWGVEKCLPVYSFTRLDNEFDKVAKGWSFRQTFYFYDANGKSRRDLIKFWGIRFVMLVSARAGKFWIVSFILHIGSSIGLFGCATVICEVLLSYYARSSELLNFSKFVNLQALKDSQRMKFCAPKQRKPRCRSIVNNEILLMPGSSLILPVQSRRHSLEGISRQRENITLCRSINNFQRY